MCGEGKNGRPGSWERRALGSEACDAEVRLAGSVASVPFHGEMWLAIGIQRHRLVCASFGRWHILVDRFHPSHRKLEKH